MNKHWRAIREELAQEDRTCQCCGIPTTDPPHHVFFGNRQGKNTADDIKKFVNHRFNLQDLCLECHGKHQGSRDNAAQFMSHQVEKYGG